MSLEVIGAGLGRTGTLSLKLALEQLGFGPCHHMVEVMAHAETTELWRRAAEGEKVDWNEIYKDYRSTVDWPGCHFYKQLATVYPKAKVVLSVRDPKKWLASMNETILKLMKEVFTNGPDEMRKGFRFIEAIIYEQTFHHRFDDDSILSAYARHIENVTRDIPADRLLVFDVAEGWEPLCKFLGVAVPETPFPRSNSREEFWSHTVPAEIGAGA